MKLWINILSAGPQVPRSMLSRIAQGELVDVFSSVDKRVIGKVLRYEVRDDVDLWAEVDVEGSTFQRAAGVLDVRDYKLKCILATNLNRDQIRSLSSKVPSLN